MHSLSSFGRLKSLSDARLDLALLGAQMYPLVNNVSSYLM